MDVLIESLATEWRNLIQIVPRIAMALIAIGVFFLIGRIVGKGVEQIVRRSNLPNTHGSFFRKFVLGAFLFFGIVLGLNLVGLKTLAAGLITGGGVTAVVLGFAFREIGENFLAGFFLAFSRPFRVGDLIESGDLRGVVQSIELRYTHVRSADGRDIFIPSSQLFKDPLVNFTRDGLRRFSFTVGIDYDDDPLRAAKLLTDAARSVDGALDDPAAGAVITGLLDSWVQLEIFYWINTFDSEWTGVRTAMMAAARSTLVDNGFTLSANTVSHSALRAFEPIALRLDKAEAA